MEKNARITALLQYLEEDPGDAFSSYVLALEYLKAGSDEAAFKLMDGLFLNQPDYLPNYYHFGKLLEKLGKTETAVKVFEKGIEIAGQQNDSHTRIELQSARDSLE